MMYPWQRLGVLKGHGVVFKEEKNKLLMLWKIESYDFYCIALI